MQHEGTYKSTCFSYKMFVFVYKQLNLVSYLILKHNCHMVSMKAFTAIHFQSSYAGNNKDSVNQFF